MDTVIKCIEELRVKLDKCRGAVGCRNCYNKYQSIRLVKNQDKVV